MLIVTPRLKLAVCLLPFVIISLLVACGGGGSGRPVLDPEHPAGLTAKPLLEVDIAGVLGEIQAASPPPRVDPAVWQRLTSELADVISMRNVEKFASVAPSGAHNRVMDFSLEDDGAGGLNFEWTYLNVGDYDRNGEVNISDLTPIGQFFGAVATDANWDEARLADGDGNGEVNISDVTPIGMNLLSQVFAYEVQGSYLEAGPFDGIDQIAYIPPGGTEPMAFSYPLGDNDYSTYCVVPVDSAGVEGVQSVYVAAAPPRLTEPLAMSPDTGMTDTDNELSFTIGLAGSIGVPISAELIETDSEGNQISVLGDLWDDGDPLHGDEFAGDSTMSTRLIFNRAGEGDYYFRASITFDDGGVITIHSNTASIQLITRISDDRFQEINDQITAVADQIEALMDTMTVPEACAQVAETLANDADFTEVIIGNEGYSVNWLTQEGFPCFALVPVDDDYNGTSDASAASSAPARLELDFKSNPGARITQADGDNDKPVGNRRVLILDPFDWTNGTVSAVFENNQFPKYDVDYFHTAGSCSVEVFKTMKDYGIVIIVSNSSYGKVLGSDIRVRSLMTNHSAVDPDQDKYFADWRQGILALGIVGKSGTIERQTYWAIRPSFLTKYCQDMPGSLVFMMGYSTAEDESWSTAAVSAGAQVFCGMKGIYSAGWASVLPKEFFADMLTGKNSSDALPNGRVDPQYINNFLLVRGAGPVSITKGLFESIILDQNAGAGSTWKGDDSIAHDLNNAGQVVGTAAITTPQGGRIHAYRWDPGADKLNPSEGAIMRDLHTFGDTPPSSRGTVINDHGDVAGYEGDGFPTMWQIFDNGTGPGPMEWIDEDHIGYPVAMNNEGVTVGVTGNRALGQKRHVMVHAGGPELTDLGLLNENDKSARATVVSEHGLIAGYATDVLDNHVGFYVKNNQLIELPRPAGHDESEVTGSRGQFTLYGWTSFPNQACVWYVLPEGVSYHKLPNSIGHSRVYAANEKGDIIGFNDLKWVIWRNGKTYAEDIINLCDYIDFDSLDPDSHDIMEIIIDKLVAINDAGQILVNASVTYIDATSENHAVLLSPRIELK